ncbi:MAG: pilin [Patescibacteria group bacterium]
MLFKNFLFAFIFLLSVSVTGSVRAQTDYKPLAPIPQLTKTGGKVDINSFAPGAIKLGIGIASGLAVIYIMIGGIQYMSTDAWGGKSEAKNTIQNAVFGLLLAVGAYAILYTVNPELVTFKTTIVGLAGGEGLASSTDPNGGESAELAPSLVGCNDCDRIPETLPQNSRGCGQPVGFICVLNKELITKLLDFNEKIGDSYLNPIEWMITEAYPPTRAHRAQCQTPGNNLSGTCLDANFRGVALSYSIPPLIGSAENADYVRRFISAAGEANLRAVYEVMTIEERTKLLARGIPGQQVYLGRFTVNQICTDPNTQPQSNGRYETCCPSAALVNDTTDRSCSWISGAHFSVYNH